MLEVGRTPRGHNIFQLDDSFFISEVGEILRLEIGEYSLMKENLLGISREIEISKDTDIELIKSHFFRRDQASVGPFIINLIECTVDNEIQFDVFDIDDGDSDGLYVVKVHDEKYKVFNNGSVVSCTDGHNYVGVVMAIDKAAVGLVDKFITWDEAQSLFREYSES